MNNKIINKIKIYKQKNKKIYENNYKSHDFLILIIIF